MSLWRDTSGSGPDLVLLHGWGMNAGVWQPLLGGLQERYRVTRIELPGHGASPYTQRASLADWAQACIAAAPASALWCGWSLGGLLAQQAALMAPQRIQALALVSATPSFVQREDWPEGMRPAVFEQFNQALLVDPAATLRRFLALQVKGVSAARVLLRQLDQALAQRPQPQPQALQDGLRLLLQSDLRGALRGLKVPNHWLFGGRDTLVSAAVAARLPTLLPSARIELIAAAGHAPLLSHTRQCLTWLEACHG